MTPLVGLGSSDEVTVLLCAGGAGANKRKAWDLKGKVSDMELKVRNYQTKVKSVNQENETLRGTMVQSQTRVAEIEKKLEVQRGQIRLVNSPAHIKAMSLSRRLKPDVVVLELMKRSCRPWLVSAMSWKQFQVRR